MNSPSVSFCEYVLAQRVSWGAPNRENSENYESSGGVRVYGRGAEKSMSKEKKKKRADCKKRGKASSSRTRTDVLDSVELGQKSKKDTTAKKGKGKKGGKQGSKKK